MNDVPAAASARSGRRRRSTQIVAADADGEELLPASRRTGAPFLAGQHVDVRLTAPDGYQAERSYSIGSAPETPDIELVIERLDDGEVSPFFHEVVAVGDTIEMRGPIGGHFIWRAEDGGPLLLVGGGSGVVPLMSMLRHRANRRAGRADDAGLFGAARRRRHLPRRAAAAAPKTTPDFSLFATVTREAPARLPRSAPGAIDAPLVGEVLARSAACRKRTYVCGANAFVDVASRLLLDMGVPFAVDPHRALRRRAGVGQRRARRAGVAVRAPAPRGSR